MPVSGPDGTGCVMLDATYDTYKNYRMIRNSGRRPVHDPRKDHTSQGLQPESRDAQVEEGGPDGVCTCLVQISVPPLPGVVAVACVRDPGRQVATLAQARA